MADERTQGKSGFENRVQKLELPSVPAKETESSTSQDGIRLYDAKSVLVSLRNLRQHRRPRVDKHGEIIEGEFDYCTRPCCESSAQKIRGEFIPALPVKDSDVPSPGADEKGDATPPYDPWV